MFSRSLGDFGYDVYATSGLTCLTLTHDYQIVRTAGERAALIAKLKAQSAFCFDLEATSRNPRTALPLGVAFCIEPHSAYYVLCGDDPANAQLVLDQLRPVLEDASIEKTGHNLKYDLTLLKWHGVEVRGRLMDTLLAHSMKEPEMRHGLDYLAKLYLGYKVALDDVTREMRDRAKTVNFGIIYGISAFGLQQRLNIPRKEASQLIDNYFAEYPAVRAYIDRTIEFAQEHGYVKTQTGRRRYLRDINSRSRSMRSAAERLAMNSPIQGTAADMLKIAMIKVHRALREGGFQTKMLLTVHDEIVFDMHRHEQSTVTPVIEECMKTALPMRVPIVVEMGVGKTWLEAH